ncbi:helix-turn-helix domain-containing protein [Cytophaga aurantiaca]|uniref:helix-turn-helix domain-containing protein n=1 Tax=Cytophaga aurantiaca TaxID=29530 RepID=UPI001FDEC381|nr:helix-turn-helix transcriptional regulator [Cytophaga aurantiaca]
MKNYELTASEFADKIDVQRSSMSHLVSGRNKPSLDFIQKILNNFSDLNPTWLIMGTGPMKQLDLFDTKGDVAPIQPIPAENFRVEPPVAAQPIAKPSISDDDQANAPDSKKVMYTQSAPTFAAVPEIKEHIHAEIPKAEPLQPIHEPVAVIPGPSVLAGKATSSAQEIPANSPKVTQEATQRENSVQNDKKVVKIVFFYSDNTFETFNPN